MTTEAPAIPQASAAGVSDPPRSRAGATADDTACAHCGLSVPEGAAPANGGLPFCCRGCEAVYAVLHHSGLETYYRLREELDPRNSTDSPGGPPRPGTTQSFAVFDDEAFARQHVTLNTPRRARTQLRLENVRCGACLWLIERLPRLLPGVIEARIGARQTTARITWDPTAIRLSRIVSTLDQLGYPARPDRADRAADDAAQRDAVRRQWVRIGWAGVCAANAMLLAVALYAGAFNVMSPAFVTLFRVVSAVIGVIALVGPGSVFFRGAWAALRTRTANLDLPIALALSVGGMAGLVNTVTGRGEVYFDSLSVLVFLLLVARYVQYRQRRWAHDTVDLMLGLTPLSARRKRAGGGWANVSIDALAVDDVVQVRSGELVPADAVVLRGRSAVDQALLTGESVAVPVGPDASVFAGTSNTQATLEVRVTRVGDETRAGRLMRLVQEGVGGKPAIVQLADRIAGGFVVAVSVIAAAVFAGWALWGGGVGPAADHTVALLIVACPCALAMATPLTFAVASAKAANRGILIKRADALELLTRTGQAWFDKTGTLTHGHTALVEWSGPGWLRGVVAQIERESIHPVGRALRQSLSESHEINAAAATLRDRVERGNGGVSATLDGKELLVGSRGFITGHGVTLTETWFQQITRHETNGHTVVLIARDGRVEALAALGDRVRTDALDAVETCRVHGWTPGVLSGDAPAVVGHVAAAVGIESAHARGGLLPEAKLGTIRAAPQNTVMIGDGVNDAAALAAADLGIAVHGGAEAALAAADVYLARDGLSSLPELFRLARRTLRVVHVNLALSLTYNATAVSLAAGGMMSPLLAAVLMPLSSGLALLVAVGGQTDRGSDLKANPSVAKAS